MKRHKKYRLKPKVRRVLISSILVLIAGLLSIVLFNNGANILNSVKNYFAAGDVPAHSKGLKDNEDGTYTLSLSVKGEAEKKAQKANIIVVFDTSSSMNRSTNNTEVTYTPDDSYYGNYANINGEYIQLEGDWVYRNDQWVYVYYYNGSEYTGQRYSRQEANQSRLQAAQSATNSLAKALLENNGRDGNPTDTIEIALVDFANMAEIVQTPTTDYEAFAAKVNSRDAGNNNRGTNWEAGFRTALDVDFEDKDTTYVIFVSDGNPTYYVNNNGTRGGTGQETTNNINTSYNQAVPAAEAIVDAGYKLYTIGIYGNVDRMEDITTDAGAPAENYYSASDTAALQKAFGEILEKIEMSGISEAVIDDGTTEQVKISSSDEHGLLKVVDNSYKYTITFPIKEGKVQLNGKGATVSGNKITWGDGKELVGQVVEGGNNFIYTWTEANDLYNFAPTATNTNGKVEWDLSDCEVLINDATYTVYFDVYPSQETYDMIAKIKNGKTVDERKKLYGALNPEVKKYLEPSNEEYTDFSLRTNTTATLSYDDTRTSESEKPVEYKNPDPVATTAQKMKIVKTWENDYDTKAETATVNVKQDGKEYISNITLTNEEEGVTNVEEFFIATGLMKVNKATGELTILDSGYDYTFSESGADDYNWELVSETIRPMIINGKLTKLIKLDENVLNTYTEDGTPRYTKPSMNSDYLNDDTNEYYKIDGEIYVADKTEGTATLNAINYRRSNLDISKTVDGVGVPETDEFTYKLTIKDTAATDDLYFSIRNADGTNDTTQKIEGARVSGDNYIISKADFIKGVTFTFTLNNGDNVRFFNLTTKATYTVEETGMPETYKFDKVTAQRKYGKEEPVEDTSATINGKIVNGSIGLTNSEYKVNFVNQYQKTRVIVTKKWTGDNNDEQGLRTPVEVELLANGQVVEGKTATLNADDWTYTWTDLDRYSNGQEIGYTVSEKTNLTPHYISSEPTGSLEEGYVIENTRNKNDITVTIPVKKVWEDNNDQDGLRNFVTFELYGTDENKPVNSYTFQAKDCEENICTYIFTKDKNDKDLPKYSGGKEINYTIKETGTPGSYQSANSKEADGTLVITNTHKPSTTKVTATKIWADTNNQDNKRPVSITFTLVKNGTPVTGKTCTATSSTNWTCSINELPEFENGGQPISYSIAELEDIPGYTIGEAMPSAGLVNTFTITNKLTKPEKTEVEVTKNWEDDNNSESTRPASITVKLFGVDKETPVKTVTLNGTADNNGETSPWVASFTDLDKNFEGSAIEYSVKEDTVQNYTETSNECTKNQDGKFECTIENTVESMPINIAVTKNWDDNSNQDGKRPATLDVTITGTVDGKTVPNTTKKVTLSGNGNDWTGTFENMPRFYNGKLIEYSISEGSLPEGYTLDEGKSNLTDRTKFKLVNKRDIEKTKVQVTKNWEDDDNSESTRPASITVKLFGVDKTNPVKTVTLDGTADDNGETSPWIASFTDLDKNFEGSAIEYSVKEDTVQNYTETSNECTKNQDRKFECTIENTVESMPINIAVTKTWDDNNNQDGKRPATLDVTITGKVNGETVPNTTKKVTLSGRGNDWTGTFEDMPRFYNGKLIEYSISEGSLPEGYTLDEGKSNLTDRTKFKLVNTHKPSVISVEATKIWADNNDQDGIRPDSITFTLVKDGTTVEDKTCTATENTDWKCSIGGLNEYENGSKVLYSITELEDIPGYTKGNAVGGGKSFSITNTLTTPETTEVQITKNWEDNENSENTRPTSITVKLFGVDKETPVKTVTLDGTADNNGETSPWIATFTDLDKNFEGNAIEYYVKEDTVQNYTETSNECTKNQDGKFECAIENTVESMPINIAVTKTWDDNNNQDGKRPATLDVTITGKVNGEIVPNTNKKVTLSGSENDWAGTFEDMPRFYNGQLIEYSISEGSLPEGYALDKEKSNLTDRTKFKLVNTHTPETVKVKVTKVWDDNNNQDGFRPETITIKVLDGTTVVDSNTKVTGSSTERTWSFESIELPKYREGQKINYTISEEFTTDPEGAYKTEGPTGTVEGGFTITNKHTPGKVSVQATKIWADNNDQDGIRPDSITFTLVKDGTPVDNKTCTADSSNSWTCSMGELNEYENGVKVNYSIKELDKIEGYTTSKPVCTGYACSVTNELTKPETTEIKITKEWIDDNNSESTRPLSITLRLYGNDKTKVLEEKTVIDVNGKWEQTFTDLDKNFEGKAIDYSVEEVVPGNYTQQSNDCKNSKEKCTITNVVDNMPINISVVKTWDDNNNQDGKRPATLDVTITGKVNGETVPNTTKKVTLSGRGNDWTGTFEDMPRFYNGQLIEYSISEGSLPEGYVLDEEKSNLTDRTKFKLVNTHKPSVISVEATKIWADNNDQDGIRPDSITFTLVKDGTTVEDKTCTATEDTKWKCSIGGLNEYENGSKVLYSITELEDIPGYTKGNAVGGGKSFSITNTLTTPETTEVQITKNWEDNENSENTRPTSITVKLFGVDKETPVKTVTLDGTADNNGETSPWIASFTDLDKNFEGSAIEYSVKEDTVQNYTEISNECSKKQDGKFECSIVNRVDDLVKTYPIKKTWDDDKNRDGMQTEVTVTLTGSVGSYSKTYDKVKLNSGNKWQYTYENLPVFHEGQLINYSVEEETIPYDKQLHNTGYTSSYNTDYNIDGVYGTEIINKHEPDKLDISGTKTWKDNNNAYSTRPESIKINLIKNNQPFDSKIVKPDESGNWSYSFNNLYRYENGNEIVYSVTEDTVTNYKTSQEGNNFINTLSKLTSITGNKNWNDNNITDYRPDSLTLVLYRNGEEYKNASVDSTSNWSNTWKDLEEFDNEGVKYEYTVDEKDEDGKLEYYTKESTGNKDNNYTVTNTMKTTKVKVTKNWIDDNNSQNTRPDHIMIHLYESGKTEPVKTASLTSENGWEYTFENLPTKSNGKDITYTVDEAVPDKYSQESIEGDMNSGFIITNKVLDSIVKTYPVKKTWTDDNNRDGIRSSITVTLTGTITGTDYSQDYTTTLSEGNWEYTFTNIPVFHDGKLISYQVKESDIKYDKSLHSYGYDTTYNYNYVSNEVSGCEIINKHDSELIKISGTKTWKDFDDEDGIRPDSITINLLKDGTQIDTKEVTQQEDGSWSYEFTDLYKFENGQKINYTIEESVPEGYTNEINPDESGMNVEVINYHMPKVTFNIHKDWNDLDDNDGKRPESITVRLLRNGTEIDSTTIIGPEWNASFADLDKYDSNGNEYDYTISEDPVEYYAEVPLIEYKENNNINITNTHELETVEDIIVRKVWKDNNNKNNNRPTSIHINLLADGEEVDEATLSESNGWTFTFKGKLKYNAGKEIVYTVTEDTVKYYDTSINGYEITNTYNGPVIEITPPNTGININNTDTESDMTLIMLFMLTILGFLLRRKYN